MLTAIILGVFILLLFNAGIVKSAYEFDSNLTFEENYKKAGREEDYEKFKQSLLDKNKSSNEKNAEVENYMKGFVPDWLQKNIKETISDIQKEDYGFSDEDTKKVEDLLESKPKDIIKDGKYQGDTSGGKFIYTLLQPLPKEGTDLSENVTLEEYLTWAFRFVLALAGFLAVMMIVIGGVEYIISGASEAMRGEAKKRIENAIWGLVMALVSYLVLYTINPSLVNFEDNCFFKDCDKETTNTEADVVFDVTFPSVETKECDFSSNGECYFKTNKYKEGDKEITQIMELPTVEGGVIQAHESYIDKEGTIFYRRGTVNTDGTITYTSEWKK